MIRFVRPPEVFGGIASARVEALLAERDVRLLTGLC
jgi:hypothetical protein